MIFGNSVKLWIDCNEFPRKVPRKIAADPCTGHDLETWKHNTEMMVIKWRDLFRCRGQICLEVFVGTEIRALIIQNLRSDWGKCTRIEKKNVSYFVNQLLIREGCLSLISGWMWTCQHTLLSRGRAKLPTDAELSFNRLRLFPGKKKP